MIVKVGATEFDHVSYYREGDVLYLWAGEPRRSAVDEASPEGHYVQFDEEGKVIAMTIVNALWLLETEGEVVVTLPDGSRLRATGLRPALAAA